VGRVALWVAVTFLTLVGGGLLSGMIVFAVVSVTIYESLSAGKENAMRATLALNASYLGGLVACSQLALRRQGAILASTPVAVGLLVIAIALIAFGAKPAELAELMAIGCAGLVPAALFGRFASGALVCGRPKAT
jgi:hypothetical protein